MNPGLLYDRITIYTPASSSQDAYGQVNTSYSTASFWANVNRERGREPDTKGIKYTYARYEFIIRNYGTYGSFGNYGADVVDETCIIVYNGVAYNVVMVELVPWSRRRYLKLVAERRPNSVPPFPVPSNTPTPTPTSTPTPTPTPPPGLDDLLLEDGTSFLLEDGSYFELEAASLDFFLLEDGTYVLLEDGSDFLLEA